MLAEFGADEKNQTVFQKTLRQDLITKLIAAKKKRANEEDDDICQSFNRVSLKGY